MVDDAGEAHAFAKPEFRDQTLQPRSFRPVAGDDQIDLGQMLQSPDDQVMPFPLDQMADREQRLPVDGPKAACEGAVDRTEEIEIDPVAHHMDAGGIGTEVDQRLLECGANRDRGVHLPCGLRDHAPDQRIAFGIEIEIGAARGDRHRLSQRPRQKGGGDAVGIVDMRVDHVDVAPIPDQPAHMREKGEKKEERRQVRADLGQLDIAGMADVDAVAAFEGGQAREAAIAPEGALAEGEPGNGRHHAKPHARPLRQFPETVLDEDTEGRTLGIGIERGDRQDVHVRVLDLKDGNWPIRNYK